ncbi:hypothetical protein [Tsuneonella mangrovi]|uniref:hypothetical protein n=1 Tax=Tsuneonella mangrovi TaxID=1982042 RepID=UPI000BA2719C|nr:hypothetical protein [Tsuneonella mangrovi]
MRAFAAIAGLMLLAACGQVADLKPVAQQSLPPTPYGAKAQPDAESLLGVDTQAAPKRSVELRERSEERDDDPFDLPPQ